MSPTALSLNLLRRSGYVADVVERFIAAGNIRKDFLGCIDIIAVSGRREPRVLAVQATSLANVAARVNKAKGKAELKTWLASGSAFQVWGWFLRAGRWQVKVVEVKGEDLAEVTIQAPRRRSRRPVQPELFN